MRHFRLLLSGLLLSLGACAGAQYAYVPADLTDRDDARARKGKANYLIPPGAPSGSVRIQSGGVVKLKPDEGGARIPALHLQMLFSNQSSPTPWTVDPKAQLVSFANQGGATPPIFVQVEGKSPPSPELVIAEGQLRSLDLYFATPQGDTSAENIPEFDLRWQVKIGDRIVRESTSFDRVRMTPRYSTGAPYYSMPPYWHGFHPWYGGAYPYGYGWDLSPNIAVPPGQAPPSKPVIIGP